jgi:glutathionyl-hydroquinone reductase
MKQQMIEQLNRIVKNLEDAVQVNLSAPEIDDQGYAYAAGYSRSAMNGAIQDLKSFLQYYNNK